MKTRNLILLVVILSVLPMSSLAQEEDVCGMTFVEIEETYFKLVPNVSLGMPAGTSRSQ